MRVACLHLPVLPLVATLRAEPGLCAVPMAVVQALGTSGEPDGRAHVLGSTPLAEGISVGMTLAEARARCPDLRVRVASTERIRAAAQAALDAASTLTPRIEEVAPGLLFLDVEGLESLVGDDRAVAHALLEAAEKMGLCAAVGLGDGKLAARLLAREAARGCEARATRFGVGGGAALVIRPEEQLTFLSGLPIAAAIEDALPWIIPQGRHDEAAKIGEALLRACLRFGLTSLGELARLPVGPLSDRLGPEGALLHRLARGEDSSPLFAMATPETYEEGEELEWAVGALEPLLFVWKSLLDRLAARLSLRGLAATTLRLRLRLTDGAWDDRALELAAPTREPGPLLKLLQLEVETRPPPEGVCAVRLIAVPSPESREQLTLFGPRTVSPAQLLSTVARLSALVGPEHVGRPVIIDRHQPHEAALAKFTPPAAPLLPPLQEQHESELARLSLSARAFRPPRAAEVHCDEQGTPKLLISEGALGGRVVACAGPWRTEAEWWTEAPLATDAFDLELAGGLLVRAARELVSGNWWIEALYD
ncbi:MAG: DNA polymerase Y family protein [Deltaproteobacteria bacterium]|nr:DNA polymerase Y family protein [Deltaproteobacteria bacterium]